MYTIEHSVERVIVGLVLTLPSASLATDRNSIRAKSNTGSVEGFRAQAKSVLLHSPTQSNTVQHNLTQIQYWISGRVQAKANTAQSNTIQHRISCKIQAKSNTTLHNKIQHNPTLDQLQDSGQTQHCTAQQNPTQSNTM